MACVTSVNKIVDARGLACPQPVIATRKALKEKLAVGEISNMYTIAEKLLNAGKSSLYSTMNDT